MEDGIDRGQDRRNVAPTGGWAKEVPEFHRKGGGDFTWGRTSEASESSSNWRKKPGLRGSCKQGTLGRVSGSRMKPSGGEERGPGERRYEC